MKQKILELLPRAGALLAALAILISCVAVPSRAASTSEAVKYYDITDYNMSGTITGGSTVKLTFDVADFASLYGESYSYSSWSLLITGEFDGTKLVTSYGATYYKNTACSYQFTLSSDWIKSPSINVKQENTGVTGRYRITGAYLVNSTYVSKHSAYYWEEEHGFNFSTIYNNLYNFSSVPGDYIVPSSLKHATLIFSPRVIIPCTTLYFELGFDYLIPEDLNISVVACSSSGTITEIYDYDLTLLSSSGYFYQYGIEVTGPFTDFVFVCVDYTLDAGAEIYFNGFYAGYNRILNTNSLLDKIREQVTQSRVYLSTIRTKITEMADHISAIAAAIANGELGSKPSTNIFDAWNSTITGLSGNFQSVVNAVKGIAGDITSGLSSSIDSISRAVEGIAASVSKGLSSSIDSISRAVDGIAASVSEGLSSSIDSISRAVSGIADSVIDGLASSFDSLTDVASSIAGDIIAGLPDIIGELSDLPGKLKDVLTPSWQSNAFGIVDFGGILDFFRSGYNSVSGFFGFKDIFEDPDGGIGWLPSEDVASDSDNITFITGLRGFWAFTGDIVLELPLEVILVFSFVFIGFLFIGFLKSF